jgi:hypothetical protein
MSETAKLAVKKHETKKENSIIRQQDIDSSHSSRSPADQIIFLQRTAGNQAVQRLLKSGTLQAKLKISQPNDIYEQEADRVAEQVMRMPDPVIQRRCSKCNEDDEKVLQTKELTGQAPLAQGQDMPSIVQDVLRSPGQLLDPTTRAFMEPRFGYDFNGVRVHTGARAEKAARAVNARAFTVGRNIVFGPEQYSQGSTEGRRLLGHELTHVIQQGLRPRDKNVTVDEAYKVSEKEVDRTGALISASQLMRVAATRTPPCIQRQEREESFAERQLHKGRDAIMEKGIGYDFSEMLDEIMKKGINHDSSKKGLDGLKVGGLPLPKILHEIPRGFEFGKRLFRFNDQGRLLGLDIQGALEIYKPRDPHERDRIEKVAHQMQEWQKILQPTEERKREEDWIRKEAARRASKRLFDH